MSRVTDTGFATVPDSYGPAKYPFIDTATLTNGEGYTLEQEAIVDLSIFMPGRGQDAYVSSVVSTQDGVTMTFSDRSGPFGTVEIDAGSSVEHLRDEFNRVIGTITGELYLLIPDDGQTIDASFQPRETAIDARVVLPQPTGGVEALLDREDRLAGGNVWLVGEDGVVIKRDGQELKVHLVGERYAERLSCESEEDTFSPRTPLLSFSITGPGGTATCNPDDLGNVLFHSTTSQSVLRVDPEPTGVLFSLSGVVR